MHGVTYDGQHVWFAAGDKLNAFDPASGKTLRSIDVAAHAGTAFDGRHLFQIAEDRIQKIDPKTGRVLATIPAPGGGGDSGLAWAEGTLWVGQYRDRKIHQIDPETGAILRTIESNRFVTGVTWVDGELWHGTWEGDESDLTAHRSANGRGPGAARDAARHGRVGARVRRRRSVLLRRRKQREGAGRAPAEARLSGEQRNVGWVEFFTRPNARPGYQRDAPSPGQGLDPPVSKNHQNLLEVGRDGQLGINVSIRLDVREPVVAGENEPSIARRSRRRARACFRADALDQ